MDVRRFQDMATRMEKTVGPAAAGRCLQSANPLLKLNTEQSFSCLLCIAVKLNCSSEIQCLMLDASRVGI